MEAGSAIPVTHYRPCVEDPFRLSHHEDLKNPTIETEGFVSKTLLGWIIPQGLEPERGDGEGKTKWK